MHIQTATKRIRMLDAAEERQYMLDSHYEVYEKQGTPTGALSFHCHNFYEIIYILEGEYSALMENRIYHLHRGDFLLIDQNTFHKCHYVEGKKNFSRRIILWITEEMLSQLSQGEVNLFDCFRGKASCAWHFPAHYEEILRGYLLQLAMEELSSGLKQVMDRGYLTLFFGYLNTLCARREYLSLGEEMARPSLVEQVDAYIRGHMSEKITVDMLARHVHMSKYYFLRRFKELTGMTVHAYLTDLRLLKACEALKAGAGIEEAGQRAGFSDYSVFLRNFKNAYGVSPRKYREFYP